MKKIICFLFAFMLVLPFAGSINKAKFVAKAQDVAEAEITSTVLAPSAKSAILMDADSGTIIFEKNSDQRLPIASMTKMMTLSVVFDAINSGKIKEDGKVAVSETSAEVEGSSAFLDANNTYSIDELIKSVVIASANDSAVALAEAVAGNEASFVGLMNEKAKKLGLNNTHFSNSTGLPAPEHFSSAYDCAIIYKTIMENPTYQKYCRIWMDELVHPSGRKTELVNTNRLVKTFSGCEAGKTGYTSEAKYCLTCSAKRNNLRLIAVVIGEPESKTRFNEVAEMFNYGFANFECQKVLNPIDYLTVIKTKGGKIGHIDAVPSDEFYSFSKKGEAPKLTVNINTQDIKTPVKVGDNVGEVIITDENGAVVETMALVAITGDARQTMIDCFNKIVNRW